MQSSVSLHCYNKLLFHFSLPTQVWNSLPIIHTTSTTLLHPKLTLLTLGTIPYHMTHDTGTSEW